MYSVPLFLLLLKLELSLFYNYDGPDTFRNVETLYNYANHPCRTVFFVLYCYSSSNRFSSVREQLLASSTLSYYTLLDFDSLDVYSLSPNLTGLSFPE